MINLSDFEKLQELVEKLKQIDDKINQYNIPRTNFSSILEDEKLLAVYHREFGMVYKPFAYVRKLRNQFSQDHQNNPQLAIENIKKQVHVLINLTNLFSPSERIRLRKIILMLSQTEIDEIHKCMADVERWSTYALRNREQPFRIDSFFRRLVVYVRGGVLDGIRFLGIFSYFRDAQLTRELLKNEAIKRLRMYKKQMVFFREAEATISRALKEPGWEGFLGKNGFYYNLRKGKRYIKMVREEFENEEFAAFLERLHEKIHEAPEAWGGSMLMLSKKLNDPEYQNQHVINPAIEALVAIFRKAIDRISISKIEFKEIDNILGKLEKDIGIRIKKLRNYIAQIRDEFDNVDNPVADEMVVVMPILIELMNKVGVIPIRRLGNIRKTLNVYYRWLGAYKSSAQRLFTKPTTPPGVAFFAAVHSDDLAITNTHLINAPLITQSFVSYIDQLENRINEVLIPKLQGIVEFIRKYDNQLTRPISNTNELLPEVQEKLIKLQDELADEFKKAGIDLTKPRFG